MSDPFVERLVKNEKVLKTLDNEKVIMLALSELMSEMATGKDVPPGDKAKRIALSVNLAYRAGVKF